MGAGKSMKTPSGSTCNMSSLVANIYDGSLRQPSTGTTLGLDRLRVKELGHSTMKDPQTIVMQTRVERMEAGCGGVMLYTLLTLS